MADLKDISRGLELELKDLNDTIQKSLTSTNELLNKVCEFFIERKGKQVRALLTLLIAHISGNPNRKTINGGAAIEMLHNASLIHDDVVDSSDMRRGRESINKLWGNQVAVLVGDFFITTGSNLAVSTGDLRIVESINKLGRQLTVGELDEIYNSQNNLIDEDAYLNMIDRKTASLFVSSAEIACLSVGASEEIMKALVEFSRLMGICFQIKDDIFDYYSEIAATLGKPVGADLIEGKVSLPLLHVLLKDRTADRKDRITLCFKPGKTPEEIDFLINAAINEGGIDYAFNKMREIKQMAFNCIEFIPNSPSLQNLKNLFEYVIERNH